MTPPSSSDSGARSSCSRENPWPTTIFSRSSSSSRWPTITWAISSTGLPSYVSSPRSHASSISDSPSSSNIASSTPSFIRNTRGAKTSSTLRGSRARGSVKISSCGSSRRHSGADSLPCAPRSTRRRSISSRSTDTTFSRSRAAPSPTGRCLSGWCRVRCPSSCPPRARICRTSTAWWRSSPTGRSTSLSCTALASTRPPINTSISGRSTTFGEDIPRPWSVIPPTRSRRTSTRSRSRSASAPPSSNGTSA